MPTSSYGVINRQPETEQWIKRTVDSLIQQGVDLEKATALFNAASRLASAAMWLVVHQAYTCRVNLNGAPLNAEDFKAHPQGHIGGSLNMVVAYVGYLLANALSGITRGWVMGQGHCVSAIDSVNLLVGNMREEHASRYTVTEEGLSRYVNDFYSYRLNEQGHQDSPLGSHVNVNTAGGSLEGGYLGFVDLSYVHIPLLGEHLVAFLSDGAFEEQRGSDWMSRWWRKEDTGIVVPIMIFNGRRIDQRSALAQGKGLESFLQHLKNYFFEPIVFDGRDPAAFACMILEAESRLHTQGEKISTQQRTYPIYLPYGIAVTEKGAGFYGEGTNAAHNLPLNGNPRFDPVAREYFNISVKKLFVPLRELIQSREIFCNHLETRRPRERDHVIANRVTNIEYAPSLIYRDIDPISSSNISPMAAIDDTFMDYVKYNPHLRPRVGNPDEILSNYLKKILHNLKHRVTEIERGIPESLDGKIITVLNEEAVACACLANKAGINLIVTYEAFAPKMLGAIRQELIWSDHLFSKNRQPGWISVPLVLTSHTYENGKNERSHQDTTMCEALLGEPSDISRVLFPTDYNTAMAALDECYHTHGKIFTLIVPKNQEIVDLFNENQAKKLIQESVICFNENIKPDIILTAIGAYQMHQIIKAAARLSARGISTQINYLIEPGRFRDARGRREAAVQTTEAIRHHYFSPATLARIFVTHTRPEVMAGVLRPLDTGKKTIFLGYTNHGGTLDVMGMLFVNRQSWAHIVRAAACSLQIDLQKVLEPEEIAALSGQINPQGTII